MKADTFGSLLLVGSSTALAILIAASSLSEGLEWVRSGKWSSLDLEDKGIPCTFLITFLISLLFVSNWIYALTACLRARTVPSSLGLLLQELLEFSSIALILLLYSIAEKSQTDFGIYRLRSWIFSLPVVFSTIAEFFVQDSHVRKAWSVSTVGTLGMISSLFLTKAKTNPLDQSKLSALQVLLCVFSCLYSILGLSSRESLKPLQTFTFFGLFCILSSLDSLSYYSIH